MASIEDAVKAKSINKMWCELEEVMAENAALEVACENHGTNSEWFYDHVYLITEEEEGK